MKKLLLLLLTLLLAFSIVGCDDTPDEPDEPDTPPVVEGYQDPSHKKGTYKVEFVLRSKTITHFYEAGEMPEAPEVPDEKNQAVLLVFKGWDTEPSAVTGHATYTAQYDMSTYEYTASFVLGGGRTVKVKATAGQKPEPPKVADYQGMTFACWDRPLETSLEDVSYTAVYTDQLDPENFTKAYQTQNFIWQSHGYRDMIVADALYALVLQEHENPMSGPVRDRIIEQITHLTAEDSAPEFTCSTNWPYGIITACIAMAKDTPSVWDKMDVSLKKRVDTLMEAFAYIVSLGTSDYNSYQTGPNFQGNYKNNWNVNYALGNIPCMVFVVYYFGNGDIEAGAKAVNDKLKGFDSDEYDRMIRAFNTYGWKNAANCWTTPAPKAGYADARAMLVNGGPVAGLDYMDKTGNTIKALGDGRGVSNGGVDFTYTLGGAQHHTDEYKNIPLNQPERIVKAMIDYNFAWTVKSDHYYGDDRVAYILDGTTSPYNGMMGMQFEFGLGNRSAITYVGHDFDMIVPLMSAARTLKRYTTEGRKTVPVLDSFGEPVAIYDYLEDAERWSRIQVGQEDFIYKYRHGWQDFVSYNQGGTIDTKQYEKNAGSGYWICKSIWRTTMKPFGELPIAESYD